MLFLNLRRQPYKAAWDLQHRLVQARLAGSIGDIVVFVEHEPVITLGRAADERHILASEEQLATHGIEVYHVERGGDVTYHGPGQLVGYPILCLREHHFGIADYMHTLEQVLINALAEFGCSAFRRSGVIGVWTETGKIAALGVRVEHGVTYHGFALNVNPQLEHYQLIIPCGMMNESVTSLQQMLGQWIPLAAVRQLVIGEIGRLFGQSMIEATQDELGPVLGSEALNDRRDDNRILPQVPSEAHHHQF